MHKHQWNGYLETIAGEKYEGGDKGIKPLSFTYHGEFSTRVVHFCVGLVSLFHVAAVPLSAGKKLPAGFQKNTLIAGQTCMYWKVSE
jgi:hypothetical protein